MNLVQLFLPLADKSGNDFPRSAYEVVEHQLIEKFEGFTAYSRTPADGLWVSPDNKVSRDNIIVYEVTVEELDRRWWQSYRERLQVAFQQQELHVRALPCELL